MHIYIDLTFGRSARVVTEPPTRQMDAMMGIIKGAPSLLRKLSERRGSEAHEAQTTLNRCV